jgi:5-methylcytosine-specific restriction endonuclease McrA
MKCKVDGCDRDAMYQAQQVCQMHYFRYMRNGTYDTILSKKYRMQNPAGYQKVNEPDHPLVCSDGYVYEHRFVYYNEISSTVSKCAMCGTDISWKSCHIDHIDNDVTNNAKENLRAVCRSCNVFRGHTPESMGTMLLTINDRTMTPTAWARVDGVEVSGATIRRRKQSGMSDYDAVFSPKKTHSSKPAKKYTTKNDTLRGIDTSRID